LRIVKLTKRSRQGLLIAHKQRGDIGFVLRAILGAGFFTAPKCGEHVIQKARATRIAVLNPWASEPHIFLRCLR